MNRISDILVIGGGITGLLTAREFAAAGYATTLIEKQKVGREASYAGGGILFPIYPWRQNESIMALWRESDSKYAELATELKTDTGIDPEWHRCGMAIFDDSLDEASSWCQKNSIPAVKVEGMQVKNLIPRVGVVDVPLIWLPEIAQIRNPKMITALYLDIKKKGVTVLEDTEVLRFETKNGRIDRIRTNRHSYSASEIVIAAGAWSKKLLGPFTPQPEIAPVKGQMLLYKAPTDFLTSIVLYHGQYLIPRLDGHILVGSTIEFSGYDKSTSIEAKESLDSFARRIFPSLPESALVDQWAGLRPGSPSGVPYIGRHPVIANLSLNCGHFRNGFGMGPASARLLVDILTNRNPCVPPEPYALTSSR